MINVFALSTIALLNLQQPSGTAVTAAAADTSVVSSSETRLLQVEKAVASAVAKADLYEAALTTQTGLFSLIVAGLLALFGFLSWVTFKAEIKQVKADLDGTVKLVQDKVESLEGQYATVVGKVSGINSNIYQVISEHHEEKGSLADAFRFSLISAATRYDYHRASGGSQTEHAARAALLNSIRLLDLLSGSKDAQLALCSCNDGVTDALTRLEAGPEEEVKDCCAQIRLKFKGIISSGGEPGSTSNKVE